MDCCKGKLVTSMFDVFSRKFWTKKNHRMLLVLLLFLEEMQQRNRTWV
jgi:hypothetical protein